MKTEQRHPASILSKQLLSQALIGLLQEKAFNEITITRLCQQAQIARRTFYRNFESIQDVLEYLSADLMTQFIQELHKHKDSNFQEIAKSYFSFWQRHVQLLMLLEKEKLISVLFIEYIKSLHQFPDIFRGTTDKSLEGQAIVRLAYTSGGLWSVLTYWIATGCKQTSTELAAAVCHDE